MQSLIRQSNYTSLNENGRSGRAGANAVHRFGRPAHTRAHPCHTAAQPQVRFFLFRIAFAILIEILLGIYIQTYEYNVIHVLAEFLRRPLVQSALIASGMSK